MILNASQLEALRQLNDELLREGDVPVHMAATVRDLLHTVEALKKEKKKWQRTAQERGQALEVVRAAVGKVRLSGE